MQVNAVYSGQTIVVPTRGEAENLQQDGYGYRLNNKIFSVTPIEALYLVEKERLAVIDEEEKKILSFQEILNREIEKDVLLWTRYIIYRDIRSKGFVVKTPIDRRATFLVYERGTHAKKSPIYEIYTIYEGMNETVGDLEQVLQSTNRSKRALKLAVVDRRGEIVYYSLEKVDLNLLELDELD